MPIVCDELHTFNDGLSEHQTVERISVKKRQALDEGGVFRRYIQKIESCRLEFNNCLVA